MNIKIQANMLVLLLSFGFSSISAADAENNVTEKHATNYQITAPKINLAPNQQFSINRSTQKPDSRRSKFATTTQPNVSNTQNSLTSTIQSFMTNRKEKSRSNRRQKVALKHLTQLSLENGGLQKKFDKKNGTPTFLKGILSEQVPSSQNKPGIKNKPGLGAESKKAIARAFLKTNQGLLKLNNSDKELSLFREKTDKSGKRHLFYQQQHNGIPIWGKQAAVHLNHKNQVYLFNGRYIPSIARFDTTSSLSSSDTLDITYKHLNTTDAEVLSNELMIYINKQELPTLVYKIDIKPSLVERWIYFVDANTGEIIHRINNIHKAGTSVNASGVDLSGNNQNFTGWEENNTFYMIDPTFPTTDVPADPLKAPSNNGDTYILNANNGDGSELLYIQSANSTSGWDATAVSALSNTLTVYDYWLNTHQRKSFDDKNKNLMIAVHLENNYNNAFWNGTFMIYGDGDNQVFGPLANCLDVAGHEMSHGVIEHTANLIYENQSGALNESFADVFGAMVDRDDWLLGEDCTLAAPGHLRNMQNPADGLSAQPAKMSEFQRLPNTKEGDNGGVHVNSGIPNRAAYLVAEGLTTEGSGTSIGREKLEKIWYKALKDYMTASSQFIDARRATIQAAKDIHGETAAEVTAVTTAWDLVEVTEDGVATPDTKVPSKTDIVSGNDFMVYLFPEDGTHDQANTDRYDVYAQQLLAPNYTYDQNSDFLLNYSVFAAYTRPAAYTDNTGTAFFYVSADGNLWVSDGINFDEQVTDTNDLWSIAISPDGRYFAYTTADPTEKNIHILDLQTDPIVETTIPLTPPDYQQDGASVGNSIYYADSLAFDYTGKLLVFDALNCVSIPDSPCSVNGDGGYLYWSIGVANVEDNNISYPFPSQDPAIDLGYPSFASNSNAIIALDMQDYTDVDTNGISSKVISIDFTNQEINTVVDFGLGDFEFWGVPSFWGDDSAIEILLPDSNVGSTSGRVPLDTNYAGDETNIIKTNPSAVAMPIMHRAGQRVLSGSLSISTSNVNFGNVTAGSTATQEILITNNGNRDVTISNVTLSGVAFSHNMTNTIIPRDATLTAIVNLKTDATVGTQAGNIVLTTDGDPGTINIALSATVETQTNTSDIGNAENDDSSGFIGCTLSSNKSFFDPTFLLLLLLSIIHLSRKKLPNIANKQNTTESV